MSDIYMHTLYRDKYYTLFIIFMMPIEEEGAEFGGGMGGTWGEG